MPTALQIARIGLGKIAASRISNIDPPKSELEKHIAEGYPQWRDSELEKRRWVFSRSYVSLTLVEPAPVATPYGNLYKYNKPNDCIRLVRNRMSEWVEAEGNVYSAYPTLSVEYHKRVDEALFPSSFVEALACRIAMECAEYETQSTSKFQVAEAKYSQAIADAGRMNAFLIGPEPMETLDENDTWVQARMGV